MQAVKNPVALDLASGVRRTVQQNEVVSDTLDRTGELLQLQNYFNIMGKKIDERAAIRGETTGMEKMIVAAIKNNVLAEAIEAMKSIAGISDARLEELRQQAV